VRELVSHRLGVSGLESHGRAVCAHEEDPYALVDRLVLGLLDVHRDDRQHPSKERESGKERESSKERE